MSVWIELMCDVRKDGADPSGLAPFCYTNRNENVMGRARNISQTYQIVQRLEKEAIAKGWLVSQGKYTCPACKGNPQ